jgi:hypothetical protein
MSFTQAKQQLLELRLLNLAEMAMRQRREYEQPGQVFAYVGWAWAFTFPLPKGPFATTTTHNRFIPAASAGPQATATRTSYIIRRLLRSVARTHCCRQY